MSSIWSQMKHSHGQIIPRRRHWKKSITISPDYHRSRLRPFTILNRNFYSYLSSYKDLSNQEFLFLKKTSLSYICFRCLYGHELIYSFDNALHRFLKNVFNLMSDEALSWPNNTKEKALKKVNYHLPWLP
jgi:hypothetical protein